MPAGPEPTAATFFPAFCDGGSGCDPRPLVVIGVRADGQKVLLAIKERGRRAPRPGVRCSTISLRAACGNPEILIVDGAPGPLSARMQST